MTYPADLTTIRVTHKVVDTRGRPLKGNVLAVATERLWATDGSIVPYEYRAQIAADGTYELDLPQVDQPALLTKGAAYKVTELVPGNEQGRSYFIAPAMAHGTGPIDATEALVTPPPPGGGVTIQAGPVTDEAAAQLLDHDGEFATRLKGTIATQVIDQAGTVPIFGSQAEAQAWETEHPGGTALWFDAGYVTVTPEGPTWTDHIVGGGTWTTPSEEGVNYSPASGTADPGQTVTVTATPDPGYVLTAPTTWTHTFPEVADTIFTDFTSDPLDAIPAGWTERWVIPAINGWKMESVASATGGVALVHRASDNARRALTWDATEPLNTTDVELVFKWRTSNTSPARGILRASGTAASEHGYYAGVRNATSQAMGRFLNGTGTLPLGPEAPGNVTADTWYITRFRIEGNQLSARTWEAANPEPATWAVTTTDASITGDGWVGLHAFGAGVMAFDWVGVAIDGKTAPKGP